MNICIGTVIKNEQEYLEDWIKYNIGLGVDKIYIVEDIGSKSHKEIIEKYPNNVEMFMITDKDKDFSDLQTYGQQYCHRKIFEYVKNLGKYDWLFLIDIDEYITIIEDKSLKEMLEEYEDYPELILYWKNFGANGHIEKPDYSVVNSYREYYTKECDYTIFDKKYTHIMKKGINLHKILDKYTLSLHYHSTANYTKTNFQRGIHTPCFERMYISHYITKSFEEYKWKLLSRGMFSKGYRKVEDFFEMNQDMIPLKDKCI